MNSAFYIIFLKYYFIRSVNVDDWSVEDVAPLEGVGGGCVFLELPNNDYGVYFLSGHWFR